MKLKKLRKQNNEKQETIAELLNVDIKTISNYENEKTEPTIENLTKIANHYNVSLDYLLERPFNNQIGHLNQKQKELAIKISKLNDIQCEQVNAILETLKITTTQETISTIKNYQGE